MPDLNRTIRGDNLIIRKSEELSISIRDDMLLISKSELCLYKELELAVTYTLNALCVSDDCGILELHSIMNKLKISRVVLNEL